ncbi:MAG TPA: CoA transferase [Acidimicrobiales bacterium]|nr:2-methylfumaryl-CoA isomerase [Actinomycetes bacterium]MDP6105106.1 CoA transferase [Acidimicrobiales bacterium]MDP6239531.1 CoA transferase [Acidimicrobiales bacterium]MDP7124168.1 CoA transferase [Acidimicrobiales bacterium]MDP7351619.1 CoA transferase [Acidimicrobiales bacterium]
MSLPLEGLTVVEGSAFVAAPSGGMTLAQLGADVIRFDRIGGGIDHRRWPLTPDGASLYWNGLNKGKRSLAVDLGDPEAQDLVAELVGRAGNFLTNFPAVGWLSYESLRQRGDGLVMVAITGNHDGTTAVDYTVNCAVGYPSVTGHADDPRPVNNVVPAWDLVCGQMAAVGLLAADRRRILEGVGDLVTLALSDVALATVSMLGSLAEAQLLGTQREAIGNDLYGAYGSDFPTGDGRRVMVVAISPKQWRGLQSATGTTDAVEALADELGVDFVDEGERYLARDRLGGLFGPWFAARTLAEVASGLDAEGVCWGPYRTFIEMVDEDQRCSTVNPLFADLDQPGVGRHLVCGSPLAFAGVEGRGAATAPRLGEHTEQVLADDLGLGATEIGSLVDRGVVAT